MAQKPEDTDSESVGFGRAPKKHRIKAGEVRNPWGRGGKPRPQSDFLDEPVELRIDGKAVRIPRGLAVDYALFNAATKGNVSAAKELDRRYQTRVAAAKETAENDAIPADGKAALDRLFERRRSAELTACAKVDDGPKSLNPVAKHGANK